MTDQQPFIGAIIAAAVLKPIAKKAATTIMKAGLEAAVERVARRPDNPLSPAQAEKVATEIAIELGKDPRAQNAVNAEPAYQSRVIVGSTAAGAGTFVPAIIIPQLVTLINFLLPMSWELSQSFTNDLVAVTAAGMTLWGAGYAIYGRLSRGLEPLFARWRKKP